MIFSIDQNCSSLWDALPKLQALAHKGLAVTHFIEDIDVAFTSMGGKVDDPALRIAMEKFHPSGGCDWGAALFYSDFLGRLPLELRTIEPQLGMKISAIAKQLGATLDELYDEFAVGDNWMLVGSSFVGDRNHHRLIGDLSIAESSQFLREIMDLAQRDCLQKFPSADSQKRTREWFSAERTRLDKLLADCSSGGLVDLYHLWLGEYLGGSTSLDVTSNLFSLTGDPERFELLELFLRDYDTAAGLYNQAIAQSDTGLHPLRISKGELPFFAVYSHLGRLVRTETFLHGNELLIADKSFTLGQNRSLPIDDLLKAGVTCLAGKAVMLVLQLRIGKSNAGLALPHNGSPYMPAVGALQRLLHENNLLPRNDVKPQPIIRVRFHLLDRMRSLQTPITLPGHLARAMGRSEIPACDLAENYASLAADAQSRLDQFQNQAAREAWQGQAHPRETQALGEMQARKRSLARENPKSPEIRELWKNIRKIQNHLQKELLRKIVDDTQISQIDFWDSRGALLPWCVALGGESFYNDLIKNAVLAEEKN